MQREYRIVRSARRTLALEVEADGGLLVRAPHRASDDAIAAFVAARTDWIASARTRQQSRSAAQVDLPPDALRARAEAELPGRLAVWAARMGLETPPLRITSAERRLGSCSTAGRICLSQNLMRWPDGVIDYVIVHELAHLRHMNHSAAFYAEVERWLPDYRTALAVLRGKR